MDLRYIIMTGFLLLTSSGIAAPGDGRKGSQDLSREEAAALARQRHPGRILSIRRLNDDNAPRYSVKMLSNGDVRVITVPEPEYEPDARPRHRR